MSLARTLLPGGRITLVLALVFPAMIASALALAYYAYEDVADVSKGLEAQVRKGAENDALERIAGFEKELNEKVHGFFAELQTSLAGPAAAADPAAANEPAAPAQPVERDRCAVDAGPFIDVFVVFDDIPNKKKPDCQHPKVLSKGDPFFAQIEALDEKEPFDWKKIAPRTPKYVHGRTPQQSQSLLFMLTVLKGPDDAVHYVIARMNLKYIQTNLLKDALSDLGKTYRGGVVDEEWNTVRNLVLGDGESGRSPDSGRSFIVTLPLGSVLWAWHVRLAPREVDLDASRKQVDRRRFFRISLIVLSTSIIAVGLAIVLLAVMAERRTSRTKSDFIANVSHELKTPLSLIRMFGEMVATGRHKGEAAAREYGGIITRESERLSHLIDNVLDFARLERGKASYDFTEGDLAGVVDRALDVCRYRFEKEKIKLRVDIEPGLPPVRMDENAITLVLLNLVDNALKYAAEGGALDVRVERAPGAVVLSVRDYGPGVSKEEQRRVFDRFYRSPSARERNIRGSGIGLALVEHIAHAHGGRVAVESPAPDSGRGKKGVRRPGAVFRVYLPAPVVAKNVTSVTAVTPAAVAAGPSAVTGVAGAWPGESEAGDTVPMETPAPPDETGAPVAGVSGKLGT